MDQAEPQDQEVPGYHGECHQASDHRGLGRLPADPNRSAGHACRWRQPAHDHQSHPRSSPAPQNHPGTPLSTTAKATASHPAPSGARPCLNPTGQQWARPGHLSLRRQMRRSRPRMTNGNAWQMRGSSPRMTNGNAWRMRGSRPRMTNGNVWRMRGSRPRMTNGNAWRMLGIASAHDEWEYVADARIKVR